MIRCVDVAGTEWPCTIDQLVSRIGAYAITLRGYDILVIETKYGLTLPGGRVEVGEHHTAAVRREVFEETNTRVKVTKVCGVDTTYWYHKGVHYQCLSLFFLCDYVDGELSTANMSEDELNWDCKPFWVPIETALERGFVMTADCRRAIRSAQSLR